MLKSNGKKQVRDSPMKRAFSADKERAVEFQFGQSVITRNYQTKDKKVQVGNDHEKAPSERESFSQKRDGEKTKSTIRHLYHS